MKLCRKKLTATCVEDDKDWTYVQYQPHNTDTKIYLTGSNLSKGNGGRGRPTKSNISRRGRGRTSSYKGTYFQSSLAPRARNSEAEYDDTEYDEHNYGEFDDVQGQGQGKKRDFLQAFNYDQQLNQSHCWRCNRYGTHVSSECYAKFDSFGNDLDYSSSLYQFQPYDQ